MNIGFEHADSFDHYFALCFNTEGKQIAKGNNFTKALDGCKANLADALEYSTHEISMLNKFLPTIGYDPLEIPEKDTSNNWLKENTKKRHQTLITTFSEKKISIYRLFDFEINTIAVTTHILKAMKNDDTLQAMADDMTTKEPM